MDSNKIAPIQSEIEASLELFIGHLTLTESETEMLQKLADICRNIIGNLFNIYFCMATVGGGSEKHMIFARSVKKRRYS